MLVLILIDVQYSQKAGFSFEKSLNRQNHISSGFLSLVKTFPIKVSDTLLHPPHPHSLLLFRKSYRWCPVSLQDIKFWQYQLKNTEK